MPIEINTNWENVKTQFQSRAKAIGELVRISRAKIDKKQIDILKSAAFELSNHIDTLRLVDSISISLANEKNIKLMYAMKEVLISIDGQPVLKDTQTFFKIQMRLEGCENEIAVATNEYNSSCIKYKRKDLTLLRTNQIVSTEVKF